MKLLKRYALFSILVLTATSVAGVSIQRALTDELLAADLLLTESLAARIDLLLLERVRNEKAATFRADSNACWRSAWPSCPTPI